VLSANRKTGLLHVRLPLNFAGQLGGPDSRFRLVERVDQLAGIVGHASPV
jgi:hypothetical protein